MSWWLDRLASPAFKLPPMTFRSSRGRAGRSLVNSLLRLVGARVVARLAFTTDHLGLPASGPPRTSASATPSCPVVAVDSLSSSAFPGRTLVALPVAFATAYRTQWPVPWRVAVAFGDPASAPGLPRSHLRLLECSLQLSPASSRRLPSVAGRPPAAPRASAFLSWDSKVRPSVVFHGAVHSQSFRGLPLLDLRPSHATGSARSVLVVSHDLDGFLLLQGCGLVASRFRPWGPSGFR